MREKPPALKKHYFRFQFQVSKYLENLDRNLKSTHTKELGSNPRVVSV